MTLSPLLPVGRLRRRDFFLWKLLVIVLGYGAFALLLIDDQALASGLFNSALLVLIYSEVVLFSKRIHDVGYSAWWLLLLLVPLANIVIFAMAFLQEGTIGENRFGADPIRNRKPPPLPTSGSTTPSPAKEQDLMQKLDRLEQEWKKLK
jgi:uncharacterized membrane protein YhaH (DUF805 family)